MWGGGAQGGGGGQEEGSGLLAAWKEYEASPHEPGVAGTSTSSASWLPSAADGEGLLGSFARTASSLGDSVRGATSSAAAGASDLAASPERMVYFGVFCAVGIGFLLMGLSLLPIAILNPHKFALCLTIGCTCEMAGVAALRGYGNYARSLVTAERLPFTVGYLCTVLGTLYASLIAHAYLLTIFFASAQAAAVLYYFFSYFPGGTKALGYACSGTATMVRACCGMALKAAGISASRTSLLPT